MRTFSKLLCAAIITIPASCASSTDTTGSWTRSYLVPEDTVFSAAVEVLEDEGFFVEADRDAGRIVAEPSTATGTRTPILVIRVVPKNGRILVDVQTRGGAEQGLAMSQRTDAAVLEILHALDRRLQGVRQ
jgi:hypothetical protein